MSRKRKILSGVTALLAIAGVVLLSGQISSLTKPAGSDLDTDHSGLSANVRERAVAAGTLRSIEDEKGNTFDAIVVDLDRSDLRLFLLDNAQKPIGTFRRLNEIVSQNGNTLVFAMNAGIFGTDYLPLGLHVENDRAIRPLNMDAIRSDLPGNFYLKPNGIFAIKNNQAAIYETLHFSETFAEARDFSLATQSGPLLVINGEINAQFQSGSSNKTLRNGVGVIDHKTVVFIISDTPVTFYAFAAVFRDRFGCQNALYLDGAISKMYIPEITDKLDESRFAGLLAITVTK